MDVQVIAVKAYGGQRYSSTKKLVLAKHQKTHGLLYLFVLYDVRTGRVHWAFRPGKNSGQVSAFMKQVRRWYRTQTVWMVLDQDPAHPRKSRRTRRCMRTLRLHWISLPKASPDDNPVENIFSDIKQSILHASHDTDPTQTRRRISAHLRGRNRRRDRHVHIPYLDDSNKVR